MRQLVATISISVVMTALSIGSALADREVGRRLEDRYYPAPADAGPGLGLWIPEGAMLAGFVQIYMGRSAGRIRESEMSTLPEPGIERAVPLESRASAIASVTMALIIAVGLFRLVTTHDGWEASGEPARLTKAKQMEPSSSRERIHTHEH